MRTGQRLTIAVAAAALSFSTVAVAVPAGAAPDSTDGRPGGPVDVRDVPVLTPPLVAATSLASPGRGARDVTSARALARPRFAFWGKKYNRIDGFSFTTAHRGSGTPVRMDVAWKRMRSGLQPLKPKVQVQQRIDGGAWTKVSGVRGRVGRQYVTAKIPAYVVTDGVAAQNVDYRLKTKKPRSGPKRARRSLKSDTVTVRYENQAMYTGDALRFYQPIAALCPNAVVTIDTSNITEENDAVFDWQYGISVDVASLSLQNNPEEENLAISVHECAHMLQFYNWGGTNQSWDRLVKRSAEVFVADTNPDPNVATPPMRPGWEPLEHAADCATQTIYPGNLRTYGGYCNAGELAAAALLWQNATY